SLIGVAATRDQRRKWRRLRFKELPEGSRHTVCIPGRVLAAEALVPESRIGGVTGLEDGGLGHGSNGQSRGQ
ncbi:hypothetical protein, partial [Klebsiella variicola]|uniref:hypothetical protein n=1 Tax=Klebsiella variicola TaxID=244366 RepID=UPI00273019A3